jgi:putative flippase GtrA
MGKDTSATPSFTLSPLGMLRYLKSPAGMKWVRFGSVSAVAIVVSIATFSLTFYTLHRELLAQTIATIVSTIPAYYLSRRWVWSVDGKSNFRTEVVPFWVLSLLQFVLSLVIIGIAGRFIKTRIDSHAMKTLVLNLVNLTTYGVMWVGKFFFLNKILFGRKAATQATQASTQNAPIPVG